MAGLRAAVEAALEPDGCRLAPEAVRHRVADQWERLEPLLAEDVQARATERLASLTGELGRRAEQEEKRVRSVFAQLEATLRGALADDGQLRLRFDGLDDDERIRHKGELIYPNLLVSLSAEHVAAFYVLPHGTDRTTSVTEFLFDPAEMAKPGFDPSDAVEFWEVVNRQDWAICESVQRGMSSRVFRSGFNAPMESWSLDIRRYIGERLGQTPDGGAQ